ncbi:MAG: 50S ribosomal protein L24 [Rickettsiales bacterium]|nr:50S ribosomal protein L24 [Rickettsiales bacterium]
MKKFKLKKGDKVIVTTGKDRGKVGDILKLFPKLDKVIVSGVGEVKKHQKPTKAGGGGIVKKSMPIHISNIAFYDEKNKKPSKIGYKILDNGDKKRIMKTSSEIIG